jgi:hypothetical protein
MHTTSSGFTVHHEGGRVLDVHGIQPRESQLQKASSLGNRAHRSITYNSYLSFLS